MSSSRSARPAFWPRHLAADQHAVADHGGQSEERFHADWQTVGELERQAAESFA
jgi:hypothetical protein